MNKQTDKQNKATHADTVDKIMAYEAGEMTEDQEIAFLTELRDSGLLFQLQGAYGRAAHRYGLI